MASIRARSIVLAIGLIFTVLAAVPACAENYARIVSLYPGHTDNVVALGAGAKLVGISENDNEGLLPGVPRLSMKAGPEALLALRPDLVLTRTLADSQNPELRKVLERAGVRVEVIDPPTWEGFEQYLRKIAELAGTSPDDAVAAHDLNAAIPFSDRYIALRGGALASQGAASELDEKVLGPLYGIEFKKYTSEEGGRAWHPSAQGF